MSLTSPIHYFSDDFLLDTSLSFEARSLYMLISSLSSPDDALYAPSSTILMAATGWDRASVETYGAELVAANIVQEVPGDERRYILLVHKAIPAGTTSSNFPPVSSPLLTDILSEEEKSALLHSLQ